MAVPPEVPSAWGPLAEVDRHVLHVLMEGPERLRVAVGSLFAAKDTAAAAERDLDLTRARIRAQVAEETVVEPDAKGATRVRSRFTNETARNDETLVRLAMDPDAVQIEARVANAKRSIDQATIQLEYERARLDAARAAARILGGRT